MKILKNGKTGQTVNNDPLRLTCNACKTEIECTLSEMTHQSPHDGPDYFEIKCPVCERPIGLPRQVLTESQRREASSLRNAD